MVERDRAGEAPDRRSRVGARSRGVVAALALTIAAITSLGSSCQTLLTVEVVDAATGQRIPAKLTVYNAGTGAPLNLGTGTGGVLTSWYLNRAYLGAGMGELQTAGAVLEIWASRGIEWTVEKQIVDPATTSHVTFTLSHAVETPGFLAADFHIHARPSFESALQSPPLPELPDRVLHYVTEGIEVMTSTDHDCVIDYAPTIASLGLGSLVTSIVGVEATPGLNAFRSASGNCDQLGGGSPPGSAEPGHWNGFPISPSATYDTTADTGPDGNHLVTAATIYDMLRGFGDSSTLVQLNHPYYALGNAANIGWLDKKSFNASVPVPAGWSGSATPSNAFLRQPSLNSGSATQGIDFDAMELWAGGSVAQGRSTRAAWFSLMNQGFLKVGTANGDSHNTMTTAGYPRSLVYVGSDDPAALTPKQIAAAVRAGKVIGTTGPIPSISVNGAGMGELTQDADGTVDVAISVKAAPWVPVEEIRIVVNGVVVQTIPLAAQSPPPTLRYEGTVPITLTRDSWILVEAGAALPANPNQEPAVSYEYSRVTLGAAADKNRGFTPLSFTNPVFVDVDGSRSFDPPGL